MVVAIVIVCAFAAYLGIHTEHRVMNPLTLFEMIFCFICIGASMRLFGLYGAKDSTYAVVFVGIFFYALGYLGKVFQKARVKRINIESVNYSFNYKLIYIFGAIALIYLIGTSSIAIRYLSLFFETPDLTPDIYMAIGICFSDKVRNISDEDMKKVFM